jgi:hypothetical protein
MSSNSIESIKVSRTEPKKAFQDNVPLESTFLFLEQFFDTKSNKIKENILSEEGEIEQIVEFEYNEQGNLISETHHFLFDDIHEKTSFKYENGLLIEKSKEYSYGSIETTRFTYNQDKLVTSIITQDEDGEEEESEVFEYEGKNLVHQSKKNALIGLESEIWYKYDEKNRILEEKKWSQNDLKTYTLLYNYEKDELEPDIKIVNEKGAIVEAHIKSFNEKKQVIKHEIQTANNGLKTLITSYEYNDLDKVTYVETINQKGITERSVLANYNDQGLLISEIKSEYEVAISAINTFTLNYEYTFHH